MSNFLPVVKRKSPTEVDQLAEELSDLSAVAESDEIEVKIEPHNLSQYHAKRDEFNLAEVCLI